MPGLGAVSRINAVDRILEPAWQVNVLQPSSVLETCSLHRQRAQLTARMATSMQQSTLAVLASAVQLLLGLLWSMRCMQV